MNANVKSRIAEAARILIPSTCEPQPFFTDCSRDLLRDTMLSLALQAPNGWSLPDVFVAVQQPKRLQTILRLHRLSSKLPEGCDLSPRLFRAVYVTLCTKLSEYHPLAAAWWRVQRERDTSRSSRLFLLRGLQGSRLGDVPMTWDDEDLKRLNLLHRRDELDL